MVITAFLSGCTSTEVIVAGGSTWNQIAIIEKETKNIIWTHQLDPRSECNSVYAWPNGDILYAYRKGARKISIDGTIIWDFKAEPGEEIQFATPSKEGYYLAACGKPARIIELDEAGQMTHQIRFKVDSSSVHGQLRQIARLNDGRYLVPLLSRKELMTIDAGGNISGVVKLPGLVPFSVKVLESGNYLISGGDAHAFAEVDPQGNVIWQKSESDIPGITLGYVAQIEPDKDGGMLISNWLGHGADATQPHIIELDKNNNVVWRLGDTPGVKRVSTAKQLKLNRKTMKAIKKQ